MTLRFKKHPILVPPTAEEISRMRPDKLAELHEIYHSAIANSEEDPYRYGFHLKNWSDADKLLEQFNEVLVSGGNRCLGGETLVFDPVTQKETRIDSITEPFHVWAWDFEKNQKVIANSSAPYKKPKDSLFLVQLENGQSFLCSAAHRVLTPSGWCSLQSLGLGGEVILPENKYSYDRSFFGQLFGYLSDLVPSTLGRYLSVLREDVQRLIGTIQDYLSCYRSCSHFYDVQFHQGAGIFQFVIPSQGGVQGNMEYVFCDEDGRARNAQHTLYYSENNRLSSPYALHRFVARFSGVLARLFGTVWKWLRLKTVFLFVHIFRWKSFEGYLRFLFEQPIRNLLSGFLVVFSRCIIPYNGSCRVVKVYHKRNDIVWDISVEKHLNYFIGDVLHKNSSKTTWAAKSVVKAAIDNPGSVILCFSQNAEVSIRQQQSAIYDALPIELRRKTLGAEANVSYTRKNGFSKSSLILPNSRSHIIFKTYAQFLSNDTILEGAELGSRDSTWCNIGAWCDEYLIGPELIATLRFRLATRNAKLIVTFTPIDGYTEVVRDYLEGAKTVKQKNAVLLQNRPVPFIQHSKNRNAGIIYFHSEDNPFGGYERIAQDLAGRSTEEILTRAYGVPTKSASTKFPNFDLAVNVVPHDKIPTKNITRYMVLDPAGRKNWFMCWIAVDASEAYYIYREWPDPAVGEWAKWHQGKYIGGDGAKGLGYGIKDYVDTICAFEEGEQVFERLIDPRLGAAKYQTQNGASSIIEDLADAGLTFVPAPGLDIEDGLQAIQSKMAYNRNQPINALNRPHFYVSDRCGNIIQALQEYTGEGGPDEAWKDPIDCIRYCCIAGCRYIDPLLMKTKKPNSGGY